MTDIFQDIKHEEELEEKRDRYKRWLYGDEALEKLHQTEEGDINGEDYDSTD